MQNNIDLDQDKNPMKMAKRRCERNIETGPRELKEVRLQFPGGDPDLEALRSVTREWLVPRLVEKFLLTNGVKLRAPSTAVHSIQNQDSRRKLNICRLSRGDSE
jgi:hypothetical protein